MTAERFKHDPQNFVGCACSTLVYVGVRDRATFDEIGLPCQDNGETASGHVLTKTKGDMMPGEVTVIFQYWIKSRTIEAWREDCERERAFEASSGISEDNCPGHVASENDPKVYGLCGVHIDSLRPPEESE